MANRLFAMDDWLEREGIAHAEFRKRCAEKGRAYGHSAEDTLVAVLFSAEFGAGPELQALARAYHQVFVWMAKVHFDQKEQPQ